MVRVLCLALPYLVRDVCGPRLQQKWLEGSYLIDFTVGRSFGEPQGVAACALADVSLSRQTIGLPRYGCIGGGIIEAVFVAVIASQDLARSFAFQHQ
jgi:hypothetical protein